MDTLTDYLRGSRSISATNAARAHVRDMAADGRAQLLPAGSRFNSTARILIDGKDFGESATLGHLVDTRPWVPRERATTFQPLPLFPA